MNEQKILVNFYVPYSIKERFDHICNANDRTRSSALIECMKRYIIEETKNLNDSESTLKAIDEHIAQRRKLMSFKEFLRRKDEAKSEPDNDLPLSFFHDDGTDMTLLSD